MPSKSIFAFKMNRNAKKGEPGYDPIFRIRKLADEMNKVNVDLILFTFSFDNLSINVCQFLIWNHLYFISEIRLDPKECTLMRR